jgi:hypothetical protein
MFWIASNSFLEVHNQVWRGNLKALVGFLRGRWKKQQHPNTSKQKGGANS